MDSTVLHDHYQDTTEIVRTHEKQRNRLFFVLIVVVGTLALQLGYSVRLADLVEMIGVGRTRVDLQVVPRPAILSATWILFSFVMLRYYQTTLHVEKQYAYIHRLEFSLSHYLGHTGLISRESAAYKTEKGRIFRTCTWITYTLVYPLLILVSVVSLQINEWSLTSPLVPHRIFDLIVATTGAAIVISYLIAVWFKR